MAQMLTIGTFKGVQVLALPAYHQWAASTRRER